MFYKPQNFSFVIFLILVKISIQSDLTIETGIYLQIGKLVHRYWSDDLRASDLKSKANSLHQQGKLEKAIDVFTQAIALGILELDLFLVKAAQTTLIQMCIRDLDNLYLFMVVWF